MSDWKSTLREVERSIEDCLSGLDRYETAFAKVLGPREAVRSEPAAVWDHKIAAITRTDSEIAALIAEQESLWQHWQNTLTQWHGLIKQPA